MHEILDTQLVLQDSCHGSKETRCHAATPVIVARGDDKDCAADRVAVEQLQQTADIDTPQEQMQTFCAMMRSIREEPEACDLAETDPVAYMGKYLYEEAMSGDNIHLRARATTTRNEHS